jgi:hypothetical protein
LNLRVSYLFKGQRRRGCFYDELEEPGTHGDKFLEKEPIDTCATLLDRLCPLELWRDGTLIKVQTDDEREEGNPLHMRIR